MLDGKRFVPTNYERIINIRWKWVGKDIPLYKLHDSQLNHIKNFVDNKRGNHYGRSSEEWFKTINDILVYRRTERVIFNYLEKKFKIKF